MTDKQTWINQCAYRLIACTATDIWMPDGDVPGGPLD